MSSLIYLIFLSLPLYLVRFTILGVPSTLLEVIIWAAFITVFIQKRWWQPSLWPRIDLPTCIGLSGLFIASVLSLLVTPEIRDGLGLWKGFIVDPLLVYLMIRSLKPDIALTWRAYGVSTLVLAGWGIMQKAYDFGLVDGRIRGPFESANYLAFFLVPTALYLIYRLVTYRGFQQLLAAVEFVIVISALVLTGSRGGYLGFAAGALVWAVMLILRSNLWERLTGWLVLGSGLVGGLIALVAFPGRLQTSDDIRKIVWGHSWDLIKSHPFFGTGLGGFHHAMANLSWPILDAGHIVARDVSNSHNLYFTLWLNLGLVGLLSIIWLVSVAVRRAWLLRVDPLAWVTLAVLASILVHGLVDTPVWKNDLLVIFWLVVATPFMLKTDETRTRQTEAK